MPRVTKRRQVEGIFIRTGRVLSGLYLVPQECARLNLQISSLLLTALLHCPLAPTISRTYIVHSCLILDSINKIETLIVCSCYGYIRYSDGSEALGLFAQETVTIRLTNGRTARLNNVLVGCTESSHGTFETADGVIGLGYRNYSFTLKAAEKFGGKFSYCLVDHLSPKNVSSYLVFGNDKQATATPPDKMLYTELLLGKINSFYAVNIKDISIGGNYIVLSRLKV